MTPLSREKIYEKLENFREYLGYLKRLREEAGSQGEFEADFHLFGNSERFLQLCIQAIIDIAHLVIIDLGVRRPDDNYGAISILHERGVIKGELASKLTGMIGLRNILVHEYGKIDRKKIYQVLATQLEDLEEFQRMIIKYLAGENG